MAEKLNLGDLKIKDFQDKEKMNADATDAGKKALEEFQGKIGTLKEDPTKVLSNFSADFSAKKTKQDSFTGMILNLTENYFEPQIGNILAPNNPVVAKQAAILFGRSFVEQGLSTLQKPKQIKNINFTPVKRDNRGFMKCEIKGEKGKILATYLVPFTPQFFKKLEAEKETIKETAIEKRKLEQIQVLDQLIGDKVINKIKKIETDLGSDVTGLRLEESDGKKLKYIFTDKSQKEKKDLPFTVVIDKSDPTNIKFRIEKTGTDKNTKWCNIDEDLEKTDDRTYRDLYKTIQKIRNSAVEGEEEAKTPLQKAGIEINHINKKRWRIFFNVDGVERSFLASPKYVKELQALKNPKEIKLKCYQTLLSIIKKDKSISSNKHIVAAGNKDLFKKSNQTMDKFVKEKGEIKETNEALKKGYAPIGTFYGVEVYTDREGTIYTSEGKTLEDYDEKNLKTKKLISKQAKASKSYKKAINKMVLKATKECAAKKSGKLEVGVTHPGNKLIFANEKGELFNEEDKPITNKDTQRMIKERPFYERQVASFTKKKLDKAEAESNKKRVEFAKTPKNEKAKTEYTKSLAKTAKLRKEYTLSRINRIIEAVSIEDNELTRALGTKQRKIELELDKNLTNTSKKFGIETYKIKINGRDSLYVLEINGLRDADKETTFSIKMPGSPAPSQTFDQWGDTEVAKMFKGILEDDINADERKIDLSDNAETIAKKHGVEIQGTSSKFEKLTILELKEMVKAGKDFQRVMEYNDADRGGHTITKELAKISDRLAKKLKVSKSEIKTIEFTHKKTGKMLLWGIEEGFGEESEVAKTILKIKRDELGASTIAFLNFAARSETGNFDASLEETREKQIKKAQEEMVEKMEKHYFLDSSIHKLKADEFIESWEEFDGAPDIMDIMMAPPFSLTKEEIGPVLNKIIYGTSFLDRNKEVQFADIFDKMNDTNSNSWKRTIPFHLEKGKNFTKEYKKLLGLGEKRKHTQDKWLNTMNTDIATPCIQLLESITKLRHKKDKKEKRQDLNLSERKDLVPEQLKIRKGIDNACSFKQNELSAWRRFIALTGGRETIIHLCDMDGNKFQTEAGIFQRYNDPVAAYSMLINRKGLYKERTDPPELIPEKVIAEMNKLLRLGYLNLQLKGETEGKIYTPKLLKSVDDLSKMDAEQKTAFQLGFLVERSMKHSSQIKEAKAALGDIKNPRVRLIVEQLLKKGVPPTQIKAIASKVGLALGGAIEVDKTTGSVSFAGIGGGLSFELTDGFSLHIAGGYYDGKGSGSIGFAVNVSEKGKPPVSVGVTIGLSGVGVGVGGAVEFDNGQKLHLHAGIGLSWTGTIVPGAGVSYEFQNVQRGVNKKIDENLEKSDYADILKKWTRNPGNPEAKYKELIRIPRVGQWVLNLQKAYGVTNEAIVYALSNVKAELILQGFKDYKKFPLDKPGIYVAGIIPIPTVSIHLGSAEIIIPRRKEIAKALDQLSDVVATDRLTKEKVLEAEKSLMAFLQKGETPTGKFVEQTGELVYSEGRLMNLQESQEVDLSKWAANIETYNANLAASNMSLVRTEVDGEQKIELKIHHDEAKDMAMYIDPALSGTPSKKGSLQIIKSGDKFFVEGNLNDLVVSRERFTYHGRVSEGRASVRDVIVLRQSSSLRGNRDRTWITQNSDLMLQKSMGESWRTIQRTRSEEIRQTNIIEVAGYESKSLDQLNKTDQTRVRDYQNSTPNLSAEVDEEKRDRMKGRIEKRRELLGQVLKKDYEKEPIQEDVLSKLDELYSKDKKFKNQLKAIIDKPTEIIDLIKQYLPKTNDKTANHAILYLQDKWYTNFIKESIADPTPVMMERIRKRIEQRVEYVKKNVLLPMFTESLNRLDPKPKFTAEKLVDKVIENNYGKLLKLLHDPRVDLEKLFAVTPVKDYAAFFSGSRAYEEGKRRGALAGTQNYSTPENTLEYVDQLGLISETIKDYPAINKTEAEMTEKEKESIAIRRVLLELASPIPADLKEFTKSPLAMKISNMESFELLMGEEDSQNYNEFLEGQSESKHTQAVEKFRKLVLQIRAAQHKGVALTTKIDGKTLYLAFKANVESGAYAKCANPSFDASEKGYIVGMEENVVLFKETTETRDATMGRVDLELTTMLAVKTKVTTVPDEPEEAPKDPERTQETKITEVSAESIADGTTPVGDQITIEGDTITPSDFGGGGKYQ